MKFSDYTYVRPDYETIKAQFSDLTNQLAQASDLETTRTLVAAVTKLLNLVDTQYNLWMIRHTIDMNDEFYNEETKFWNEYSPLLKN